MERDGIAVKAIIWILILAVLLAIPLLPTKISSSNAVAQDLRAGLVPITPANADQLVELARFGRGSINALDWSSDGRTLAVGGSGGVWLYNTDDLEAAPRHLELPSSQAFEVAFSPDSTRIAAGGFRIVIVWDVTSGEQIASLDVPDSSRVYSLAFSPNGSLLAFANDYSALQLYNLETGESRELVPVDGVTAITFSPDGRLLAYEDVGTVNIVEVESGNQIQRLSFEGRTWRLAFSPDGTVLAMSLENGTVGLFEISTRELTTLTSDSNPFLGNSGLAFRSDGLLAVPDLSGRITLWDVQTKTIRSAIEGNGPGISDIVFEPAGERLAVGSRNGTVHLWDIETSSLQSTLEGHTPQPNSIAFSPDGSQLAVGGGAFRIWLWDTTTGLPTILDQTSSVVSLDFTSDGRQLLVGGMREGGSIIETWNLETRTGRILMEGGFGRPHIALSPDGGTLTFDWTDASVYSIHMGNTNGQQFPVMSSPDECSADMLPDRVDSLTLSPDNATVAFSMNQSIWLLNATSCYELLGHESAISSLDFSPDGTLLASGGGDGTVRLWDVASKDEQTTIDLKPNFVSDVAFNSAASLLAIGGTDNTVRLWDVIEGKEVALLQGYVLSLVAFSSDDTMLATGSADGTIRLWGTTVNGN